LGEGLLPSSAARRRKKKTLTFPPLRGGPLPLPQAGEGYFVYSGPVGGIW
jgi:hypothetical protein